MADLNITDTVSLSTGVRYEDAVQTVTTGGSFAPTDISNAYFLPAATLTVRFGNDMQLRLHGSKTLARPQFRELAPQQYEDFESDRSFFGNPFLEDTEIYNAEARIEYYLGRDERVSLSGFYKGWTIRSRRWSARLPPRATSWSASPTRRKPISTAPNSSCRNISRSRL
jgi:outer membrane receptor protein involved in Fe transport